MFKVKLFLLLSVVSTLFMVFLLSGCDTEKEDNLTLEIDVEGPGEVLGSGTYPEEEEVTVEATPEKKSEFIGWHKDGEKVSSDSNYHFEIHQDTQLKAVFEDKENGEKIKSKHGKDVVYFKCNVLEEVIKNKLNIEGKVKKEDMKKIEGILPQDMIPHEGDDPKTTTKIITSLEGLQYAKNLEKMHFGFAADDLSPLSELDNLKVIKTRRSSNLKDLSPISNLDNLEILHIDFSSVEDLSPISELDSLKELRITTSSEINDISPLSNLKQLEVLDLGDCLDSNRTPSTYELSSLSGLEKNLKKLRLDGNYIRDKSYLANFTNLELLELRRSCFNDDFTFLAELKDIESLKEVNLMYNKLDEKAMEYIEELKEEGIEVRYHERLAPQ